jgi:hypothetical protein
MFARGICYIFQLLDQEVFRETIYTVLRYLKPRPTQRTRYFITWLLILAQPSDALQAIRMNAWEDSGIAVSLRTNRTLRHTDQLLPDVT